MNKKQKLELFRILLSAAVMAAALIISDETIKIVVFFISYAIIGFDVLWSAICNIFRGQVFDENFLMAIATVGALVLGDYAEAVTVMLFYQVGDFFEGYAVGRSRKSIAALMDIRPDYANIEIDGVIKRVSPEEVAIGDVIIIKPGERVPLDGEIISGGSSLDTAALTGESLPREVQAGDSVISGCVNINGLLKVRVDKFYEDSTVARILELVENASSRKATAESFISKFARYYTPIVVIAAVVLAVLPPLIMSESFAPWIERALIFLVVSCPCALVISVPLTFFGGIGGASRCGILVKGGNYLEVLAKTEIVVFDKTGTLTKGSFVVSDVQPQGCSKETLLELAALAESFSDHPISRPLREAYSGDISRVSDAEEVPGKGVRARVDGAMVCVGNRRMMEELGLEVKAGALVHVACEGVYKGYIVISDELKSDAAQALIELKKCGIKKTVMLTGDTKDVGERVASELGIDEVCAELLPEDKVARVEKLISETTQKLAFVGDGINDAPVLSRADIGIAMGALGSDAAIEAADIVLMDDQPSKLATAIKIARKTISIVKQNIIFALGVKGVVLVMGATGYATMWLAVFADVGVSVIAIMNATRALRQSK